MVPIAMAARQAVGSSLTMRHSCVRVMSPAFSASEPATATVSWKKMVSYRCFSAICARRMYQPKSMSVSVAASGWRQPAR